MPKQQNLHHQNQHHQNQHHQNQLHLEQISEKDFRVYESKLLSDSTTTQELEQICMTLSHQPSKQAQDLLALFKESDRAHEVAWLDFAIEEGQFHYNEPETEEEERDYLALKVQQELMDTIFSLQLDMNEAKVYLEKMEIQHQAIRKLVEKGELDPSDEAIFRDAKILQVNKIEEISRNITLKEKTCDQIEASIQTEKYKDLDPLSMRDIHW